jgi:NAD(P)H-dependent FMN reductase
MDVEDSPPAAWTHLQDSVATFDDALFITPECNGSVPAARKNAVDVGLRPGHASAHRLQLA